MIIIMNIISGMYFEILLCVKSNDILRSTIVWKITNWHTYMKVGMESSFGMKCNAQLCMKWKWYIIINGSFGDIHISNDIEIFQYSLVQEVLPILVVLVLITLLWIQQGYFQTFLL